MISLKAAEILAEKHSINAEVIDLRSIRPLDETTILNSVKKTHRAVLVEENKPYCGVDAQISHLIQYKAFDDLMHRFTVSLQLTHHKFIQSHLKIGKFLTKNELLKACLSALHKLTF